MTKPRAERILPSMLGAIGKTPLVELSRLTRRVDSRSFAKLEHLNPGSPKKDRIEPAGAAVLAGKAPAQTGRRNNP